MHVLRACGSPSLTIAVCVLMPLHTCPIIFQSIFQFTSQNLNNIEILLSELFQFESVRVRIIYVSLRKKESRGESVNSPPHMLVYHFF